MVCRYVSYWIAAGGLSLATFGQNGTRIAAIPRDRLELVNGGARAVNAPAGRAEALRLLDRARNGYALRRAGRGYDLRVTFTVNPGSRADAEGPWKMHDLFDPRQGLRWTAQGPGSYAITRISSNGMLYGEETANYIPLRLQEARAALFDPIPGPRALEGVSLEGRAGGKGGSNRCAVAGPPGDGGAPAPGSNVEPGGGESARLSARKACAAAHSVTWWWKPRQVRPSKWSSPISSFSS